MKTDHFVARTRLLKIENVESKTVEKCLTNSVELGVSVCKLVLKVFRNKIDCKTLAF